MKTDKRDAPRLALLLRAGQLTAVGVPSLAEEAVRDLCRARADMVQRSPPELTPRPSIQAARRRSRSPSTGTAGPSEKRTRPADQLS